MKALCAKHTQRAKKEPHHADEIVRVMGFFFQFFFVACKKEKGEP